MLRKPTRRRKISAMNELTPLGRLIQAAQEDLNWSDRDIAARAGDERGLGKSNVGKLKKGDFESVKASTLKRLSELLRVPEVVLVQAALDTLGLRYSYDASPTLEDAVAADRSITERDKRVLLAAVTEMKASGQDDRQGEEEPGTEARSKEHGSTDSSEDGSEARRTGAAIGEVHQLHPDQGKLQPPPDAEKSAAWRTENRGKKIRQKQDEHAEE